MKVPVNKISRRIITVEPHQDIAGLIDAIRESKEDRLYLDVPEGYRPLENKLNMQLIKNEGEAAGKEIVIVSENPHIRKAAGKLEVSTAHTLPSGRHSQVSFSADALEGEASSILPSFHGSKMFDIIPPDRKEETLGIVPRASHRELAEREEEFSSREAYQEYEGEEISQDTVDLEQEEGEKESAEEVEEAPYREERFFTRRPRHLAEGASRVFTGIVGGAPRAVSLFRQGAFFVGAAAVLAGIAVFVYFILPKAEVRLEPKKDLLTFDLAIRVSARTTNADYTKNVIPGELLESTVEHEETFISSGREVREEKARGTLTIFNEQSSSPQTLVENTRFVSQDGKLFRTTETVVVPGARVEEGKIVSSSIDVEAVAAEPGEEYNIGPSTFSIPGFKGTPKYTTFYGKSTSSMEGGFIGEVEVVTEEDFAKAQETFREALLTKAREEFKRKTPHEFVLLERATQEEVLELVSDKEAREAAKSFTLSGKAKMSGFVFDENDVRGLVDETIETRISKDKEVLEDTKKLTYKEVELDLEGEEMTLLVGAEEWLAARINEEEIINEIRGKSLEDVRGFLASHPALNSARVTFSPFWIKRVPRAEDKIKIEIVRDVDGVD